MPYKLLMSGIPIDGEVNIFSKNYIFCKSASHPEVTLKKKQISICFNALRKSVEIHDMRFGFVKGKNNLVYCFIN